MSELTFNHSQPSLIKNALDLANNEVIKTQKENFNNIIKSAISFLDNEKSEGETKVSNIGTAITNIESSYKAIQDLHLKFQENLMLIGLAYYYNYICGKNFIDFYNYYKMQDTVSNLINGDDFSDLSNLYYETLNFQFEIDKETSDSNNNLNSSNEMRETYFDKISSLARNVKENFFNKIKSAVGLSNIEITDNGVDGLKSAFRFIKTSGLNGSITFTDSNGKEFSVVDEIIYQNVLNNKEIKAKLKIEAVKDIVIQDGSSENPYLIYTEEDAIRFGLVSRRESLSEIDQSDLEESGLTDDFSKTDLLLNVRLMNDIYISSSLNDTFSVNCILDGNGRTVVLDSSIKTISLAGKIIGNINFIFNPVYKSFLFLNISQKMTVRYLNAFTFEGDQLNFYLNQPSNKTVGLRLEITGTNYFDFKDNVNYYYTTNTQNRDDIGVNWLFDLDVKTDGIFGNIIGRTQVQAFVKYTEYLPQQSTIISKIENEVIAKGTEFIIEDTLLFESVDTDGIVYNYKLQDSNMTDSFITMRTFNNYFKVDLSSFKISHTNQNGMSKIIKPFINYNDVLLVPEDFNDDINDIEELGYIITDPYDLIVQFAQVLYKLINIRNYVNSIYDEAKKTNDNSNINYYRYRLEVVIKSIQNIIKNDGTFEQKKNQLKNLIDGSAQTFIYINGQKTSSDSNANTDYLTEILDSFNSISKKIVGVDFSIRLNRESRIKELSDEIKNNRNNISKISTNLVSSLTKTQKLLNNYGLYFQKDNTYTDKFKSSLQELSDIITSLETAEASFQIVRPAVIRNLTTWLYNIDFYDYDGFESKGYLYIAYDLFENLSIQNIELVNDLSYQEAYEQMKKSMNKLTNYAIKTCISKNLFQPDSSVNNNDKEDIAIVNIIQDENNFSEEKDIIINLNASYEKINPALIKLIPEMIVFNTLDCKDILERADAYNNNETGVLADMLFLNYIFKNIPDNISKKQKLKIMRTRIDKLEDVFNTNQKTFKMILLEMHYRYLLKTLFEKINELDNNGASQSLIDEIENNFVRYLIHWNFEQNIENTVENNLLEMFPNYSFKNYIKNKDRNSDYIANIKDRDDSYPFLYRVAKTLVDVKDNSIKFFQHIGDIGAVSFWNVSDSIKYLFEEML